MKLNQKNVPSELHSAIQLAEKWGIGDDYEREQAIVNASRNELEELAHSLDDVDDGALVGWLTGKESKQEPLSQEYLAFTNLTMAVQSAKIKIKRLEQCLNE